MRLAVATLLLTLISVPSHSKDRYSGRYAGECGHLVCELDIQPDGDGWSIEWSASDPTSRSTKPICNFETTAHLGTARMGPVGTISNIAVGKVSSRSFGLFDLGEGRVSWSSTWMACRGVAPKATYSLYGDE